MATCSLLLIFVSVAVLTIRSSATVVFVHQPASSAVVMGGELVLDCFARETNENLPLAYTWEFNSDPVYLSLPKAEVFVNKSLYVGAVDQADLGTYQCVVQVDGQPSTAVTSSLATVVEAYIEEFFIQPESMSVINGNATVLECVSGKSAPPVFVRWEKDGQLFTQGQQTNGTFGSIGAGGAAQVSSKLELMASPDLAGQYVCVAENPLTHELSKSNASSLTVSLLGMAPEILVASPPDVLAPAGLPLTLDCLATGHPKPEITWFKNDGQFVESGRISILTNGSLYFRELRESDRAGFKCVVVNVLGSMKSALVNVTVAVLDVSFVRGPSNVTVRSSQPVSLPCVPPRSIPVATILWYKDNVPFVPRPGEFEVKQLFTGTLQFNNVQIRDEGKYFCVAVNNYSVPSTRTSQVGSIIVREASPIFIEPPVPTRIIKGEVLRLTCRVEARPNPSLQWYKNEDVIHAGQRVSFQDSGQILVIRTSNKDDQGSYWCRAVNQYGTRNSAPVPVFVVVPPEIVQPPGDMTVREGTDVLIRCQVYGDPMPEVTWYKDGTAIKLTNQLVMINEGLRISDVSSDDEGVYRCEAVNEGGQKTAEATLLIQVAPDLFSYPANDHVRMGTSTSLHCEATGVPSPTYFWTFNGTRSLPPDSEVKSEGRVLLITSATPRHTGTYVCYAVNVAGKDSRSTSLFVEVSPLIINISGESVLDQADDLDLTCEVTGIPTPSITWHHNGQELTSTTDSRVSFPKFNKMRIQYVRGYNSGEYQCVAVNDAGMARQALTVYVRETPLPPELIAILPVSMTSVNLTWQPVKQEPNNQVDTYVIQYKERVSQMFSMFRDDISTNLSSYEVAGLLPFTEYVFRIASKNHIGVGVYSAALGVRTLETAPSEPRNLRLVTHNATVVELQWEVPANTNGDLRTYQVHYKKKYTAEVYSVREISIPSLPLQHYKVTGLQPYTTYEFKVRGATIEGSVSLWGAFSVPLDVTTSAAVPSAAPPGLMVQGVTSRSMYVTWKDLPEEFHNGPLQGYVVHYKLTNDSQPYTDVNVSPTQLFINITELSPWKYYNVSVAAYSNKGRGVVSDVVTVRTKPEAPSGAPTDVQVAALSDTSISVTWKPLQESQRNSDISGYIVEYKMVAMETEEVETLSKDIGNPRTKELLITGLQAWTEYEVRVQAFSTLVANGFGPYSPTITIRTKQGIPGPIQNVMVTVVPSGVILSWLPPVEPNGIINQYVITYSVILPPTTDELSTNELDQGGRAGEDRVKRDIGQLVSNNTWELRTNQTNVTIEGLDANTNYSLSIAAETAAGRAATPVTVMAAIVASQGSDSVSGTLPTTSWSSTGRHEPQDAVTTVPPGDRQRDDLPIIIGASVAGSLVLIVLLLLLIYCCCRRQRHRKGIYYKRREVIPPMAFTQQALADLQATSASNGQVDKSDRSKSPSGTDTTVVRSSAGEGEEQEGVTEVGASSIAPNEGLHGEASGDSSLSPRPLSEASFGSVQLLPRGLPLDPLFDLTYTSLDELHLAHLQGTTHPYLSHSRGLVNPVYEADFTSSMSPPTDVTFLRPSVYTSQQDLYAQVQASKRRKNRMKSQTAAAIAAQRNATSSMFLDTDALIKNDSVVVYDERTAL